MNLPTSASLAPAVVVFGIIVSATSSRKAISLFEKAVPATAASLVLQPARKNSPPITAPPVASAIIFKSSLLSIWLYLYIKDFLFLIRLQHSLLLLPSMPYKLLKDFDKQMMSYRLHLY